MKLYILRPKEGKTTVTNSDKIALEVANAGGNAELVGLNGENTAVELIDRNHGGLYVLASSVTLIETFCTSIICYTLADTKIKIEFIDAEEMNTNFDILISRLTALGKHLKEV